MYFFVSCSVHPLTKTNIFSIPQVHCSLNQGYSFAIYSLVGQTPRFNDSKLDEIETKQSINCQSTVTFISVKFVNCSMQESHTHVVHKSWTIHCTCTIFTCVKATLFSM